MAGAANCAKVRITGRQQWFGDDDAPNLLTASINGRIGDRNLVLELLYILIKMDTTRKLELILLMHTI